MSESFEALCATDEDLCVLRGELRDFLIADQSAHGWESAVDAWLSGWDPAFSRRLGNAGFLGLTIPRGYGGHGRGYMHRYVVTEELLVCGAPVAAHWMADRQVAPALLAYGTEEQRRRLLPRIASGDLYFAIGLSEHDAGSDLAGVRTRALRVEGGWRLSGTKVWTSGAHVADVIVVLARTSPLEPEKRHAGLSQFLVPRNARSVRIDPIVTMSGEHHFNEVTLDDVFVPDEDVLGEIGSGWAQVTAELSFERSGPERILTTAPMIFAAIRHLGGAGCDTRVASGIGSLVSRMVSLRQLSISVARTLTAGDSATLRAAAVKDLGTGFEQDSVDVVQRLLTGVPRSVELEKLMTTAFAHRPMFTLRGGTNEVLRSVVARGMGLR